MPNALSILGAFTVIVISSRRFVSSSTRLWGRVDSVDTQC